MSNKIKIAVLGIGNYFRRKKKYIESEVEIACYADNDQKKWNTCPFNDGVVCVSPDRIVEYNPDKVVIAVQKGKVHTELEQQAQRVGLETISIDTLINEYIDSYELRKRGENKNKAEALLGGSQGHRIILMNTPEVSSTIGDHAIATSERLFLDKYFRNETIIEIGDRTFWECRNELKQLIYPSDVLLIQGGGYLGSLWRMWREDTIRYILQTYSDNPIIILPQTMFFENDTDGRLQREISKMIYNQHENVTFCFREKNSYVLSKDILGEKVPSFLIPDLVLSMQYTGAKKERKSVAICFKNDKETILLSEEQEQLKNYMQGIGYDVVITTMFYEHQVFSPKEREQIIRNKMEELAGYELMITDAMHGMVLATVCGTACIGVESITGKVGGIYRWIQDLPYVKYTDSLEKIKMSMQELKQYMKQDNLFPSTLLESHYEELVKIIKGKLHP